MFCDGYGIYTREQSYRAYFHKQHKTLYYIFSPNPAVSYVADKQVSHREICAHYVAICHNLLFLFSNGFVYIGQLDFISSVFV